MFVVQHHLNGVHISEVPKFLAGGASVTTHANKSIHPFDAAYPLIIWLWLSGVTSYFDVHYPNIADYENEDIPKIHITS